MLKTRRKANPLQKQIDAKQSEIHSDQYSMSIGEIANMYRDGEIDIHPEFQRIYRWSDEQKSRFIESLLLGIPIPSLFVAQREDGKWDVIDGLQRLSTILQLMGCLKDQDGETVPKLVLTKTRYLPALEGMVWDGKGTVPKLDSAQQLYIKRAKLDFKIILRESGDMAKFELFQRLNTGGSELSDQEIRNAMLVAAKREFFVWLKDMAGVSEFKECVCLSERSYDEQYDLELILRFRVFRTIEIGTLSGMGDLGDFLTDNMQILAETYESWSQKEDTAFKNTFELIAKVAADNAFRRFDEDKNRFLGGFSISAFEVVAMGIGYHIKELAKKPPDTSYILDKIKGLWSRSDFTKSSAAGARASTRIPKTLDIGRELFRP